MEYHKALSIYQELLGETGVFTACTLNDIGLALGSTGLFDDALIEHRKVLAMIRELYGEDHKNTSNCYEFIGGIFLDRGQPDNTLIGYGKNCILFAGAR